MAKKKVKKAVKKPEVAPLSGDAYEACVKAHAGQAGYCDQNGGWHPAT